MNTLEIFDPAMCCSTGVCGPTVDPKLARLAADAAYLKAMGVQVERHNLAREPQAFAENPLVLAEMGEEAEHLPLFIANGELRAKGRYPARAELAAWFGLEAGASRSKPLASLKMADQGSDHDH